MEIEWTKAYNGRVLHAFTEERRPNQKANPKQRERKTLCGKWFSYWYSQWEGNYVWGRGKCKKCEEKFNKLEVDNDN